MEYQELLMQPHALNAWGNAGFDANRGALARRGSDKEADDAWLTRDPEAVGLSVEALAKFEQNARMKEEAEDGRRRVSSADSLFLDQLMGDDPLAKSIVEVAASTSSSDESPGSDSELVNPEVKVEVNEELKPSLMVVPADEVGLSPLEIRRKRNRESMQRARQRQRDEIETMKITVRDLERHFQQLSEGKNVNAATMLCGAVPLRLVDRIEAEYRALAELSRQLKEQNFMLEKMLIEKQKTWRRLQQGMVDRQQELGLECPTTTTNETLIPRMDFVPISEQVSDDAMKQCYDEILRLEKISKPLSANAKNNDINPFPATSTFGWRVGCHPLPDDNGFFVCFSKSFANQDAEQIMHKTWTVFGRPENNAGCENPQNGLRMETLQVVNDNAYVAAREIEHPSMPNKILRSIFLRFRLQTDENRFVIGRACMNPTNPELRAVEEEECNIVYGDYSSWIEFKRISDGDEQGCEVKFGAMAAYDSQQDMQLRIINSLMTTVAWETAIISPQFTLEDDSDS